MLYLCHYIDIKTVLRCRNDFDCTANTSIDVFAGFMFNFHKYENRVKINLTYLFFTKSTACIVSIIFHYFRQQLVLLVLTPKPLTLSSEKQKKSDFVSHLPFCVLRQSEFDTNIKS